MILVNCEVNCVLTCDIVYIGPFLCVRVLCRLDGTMDNKILYFFAGNTNHKLYSERASVKTNRHQAFLNHNRRIRDNTTTRIHHAQEVFLPDNNYTYPTLPAVFRYRSNNWSLATGMIHFITLFACH